MKFAVDVHRDLLGRDVPHEILRLHGVGITRAGDLPAALGVPERLCVRVKCFLTARGPVAAIMAVGAEPEPRALLRAADAQWLRTATPDEVNEMTDFSAGLVCPVGLPTHVLLFADTALQGDDVLYCPVGEAGVVLGIRSHALLAAVGAQPATLICLPAPGTPDIGRTGSGQALAASAGSPAGTPWTTASPAPTVSAAGRPKPLAACRTGHLLDRPPAPPMPAAPPTG